MPVPHPKKFRVALTVAAAAMLPLAAFLPAAAQVATRKSPHPCVKEICIGDGLQELGRINWEPVLYTSERVKRIRKEVRVRKARTYKGFGAEGVPSFLIVGVFDNDLLDDMARVPVACEPNEIAGTYVTDSGHTTTVRATLMPNSAGKDMIWRVTGISRMYSGIETSAQRNQLSLELNTRYADFLTPKTGESGVLIVPMGKEMTLNLHWVDLERNKQYGASPLCEGRRQISVD